MWIVCILSEVHKIFHCHLFEVRYIRDVVTLCKHWQTLIFQGHMITNLADMTFIFLWQEDHYSDPWHLELPTFVLDCLLCIYGTSGIWWKYNTEETKKHIISDSIVWLFNGNKAHRLQIKSVSLAMATHRLIFLSFTLVLWCI